MLRNALLAGLALTAPLPALAAIATLDLANYALTGTHALPVSASEASAVTWNHDTDTLFVVGDEGDALVEVSKTGVQLSVMILTGFDDTEGLTYIGGGQFVIVEERLRDAYRFTYVGGGGIDRSSLDVVDLGATVANIGVEGISFDPRDGTFISVKERLPQEVGHNVLDFDAGTAVVSSLFDPEPAGVNLDVLDLSDVQVLATVPMLQGGADADNLLIYSQESGRLLETDRSGHVLSDFFLVGIDNAEGVTVDADGIVYLVGEDPALYVLTAVPLPSAFLLLGSALALVRLRRGGGGGEAAGGAEALRRDAGQPAGCPGGCLGFGGVSGGGGWAGTPTRGRRDRGPRRCRGAAARA